MAILKALNDNPVSNNGGSVISGGSSLDASPVLGTRINSGKKNLDVFASTVVEGVNNVTALTLGVFAKLHKIVAKRISSTLAGTINNATLLSGAAVPGLIRSIHKMEVVRVTRVATALRAGYWNEVTGSWTIAPVTAVDVLETDNAANPTRTNPGSLVYKTGAPTPTSDEYKSKTN
jgi:hypothetical protein